MGLFCPVRGQSWARETSKLILPTHPSVKFTVVRTEGPGSGMPLPWPLDQTPLQARSAEGEAEQDEAAAKCSVHPVTDDP